jgi:glycosyltransferase involved in cell wall biosynthesis
MRNKLAESRLPLVSVVVPTYNAVNRIETTLKCVVRQTYPCIELVLVDDGSADSTSLRAERYLRKSGIEWRLLRQLNGGPSKARNLGWRAARGDIIQFLDDDDEIVEDKIILQVAWMIETGCDAALIYSTWSIRHWASPESYILRRPACVNWQLKDVICSENFFPLGSGLVRKSWLELVNGFDERYRLIEDVDLQIRILAAGGRFEEAPSDKPLFFYNRRAESLSQTDSAAFVEGCIRNARLAYKITEGQRQLDQVWLKNFGDVYRQGIAFYAETDRGRFDALYREFQTKFAGQPLQKGGLIQDCVSLFGERRAELLRGGVRRARRRLRKALTHFGLAPSRRWIALWRSRSGAKNAVSTMAPDLPNSASRDKVDCRK